MRYSLCHLLSTVLGLEVVGMAQNGPDALEMLNSLAPDILITDIRMPGFDGLHVVQEAHRLNPQLEVIVISGYAQFDYAQTAIRFGVGEYLLKPINRDALNHSLEKMAERCRARQRKETDMETLLESRDDDCQHLRTKLVGDLLAGQLAETDADTLKRAYHFNAAEDTLQLLLLKMDYDPDHFGEPSLAIVRDKAQNLFQPTFSEICTDAVCAFADATLTCVMNYPHARQETLRTHLRNNLNRLVAEKEMFGNIEFSMALSAPCHTLRALTACCAATQNGLAERLIEGTGSLMEGEAAKSGALDMDFLARYTVAATHAIDVVSLSEADAAAGVIEEATAVPGVRGWELLALVRMAGTVFCARLSADHSEAIQTEFNRHCLQCSTAAQLFERLRRFQQEQLTQLQQRLQERDTQPIRNAKLYILKNYAQPITLEEVSAEIGFSVNYFSTLFKKETGEGFAKYLTRVRIDEARSLLRDTNQPVAEICKNVGYGDLKHFTHTFKTETGLTPGEYRKLYG